MESSRGLGDLQGVNKFFLFVEKRIQRFDEGCFQGGEMKWIASSREDKEFVLIIMFYLLYQFNQVHYQAKTSTT